MEDIRSRQCKTWEAALEKLAKQFDAAVEQSVLAIDAAARMAAEQQADEIQARMDAIGCKIAELKLKPADPANPVDPGPKPTEVDRAVEAQMHQIDFDEVVDLLHRLINEDRDNCRAGLMLFRHCEKMNGRLCAQRVIHVLKEKAGALFDPIRIRLRHADRNDRAALLVHLGREFGLRLDGRPIGEQLELVCRGLKGRLQAGSIGVIEVQECDWLIDSDPAALGWLVEDLWGRLVREIRGVGSGLPGTVTLIGLLFFDDDLPADSLCPTQCCPLDAPVPDRLLAIELRHWTENDIFLWLMRFGMPGRPVDEIGAIARRIFKASDGLPTTVETALIRHCRVP